MSRDIRSFFTPLPKKQGVKVPSKKRSAPELFEDDIIPNTPEPQKPKQKKRKVLIIESDSEGEESSAKVKSKPKPVLKPVSAKDVLGTAPVKQTQVDNAKKPKTRDDFEKTLQQLDDDDFNINDLDKTIEEALHSTTDRTENKTNNRVSKTMHKTLADEQSSKKRKVEDLNDSGLDPDEERHERRRYSSLLYQKYLNRSGPSHKGQKELPKGKPDCLKNLCFLKTGVLDSMDKDDVDALVKEHGGRTVSAVSRKVNYIIVGEDPGPAKIEKARNFGIKEISEDELLDLILTKSGVKPKYASHRQDEDEDVLSVRNDETKSTTTIDQSSEDTGTSRDRRKIMKEERVPTNDKNEEKVSRKDKKGERTLIQEEKGVLTREEKVSTRDKKERKNLAKEETVSNKDKKGAPANVKTEDYITSNDKIHKSLTKGTKEELGFSGKKEEFMFSKNAKNAEFKMSPKDKNEVRELDQPFKKEKPSPEKNCTLNYDKLSSGSKSNSENVTSKSTKKEMINPSNLSWTDKYKPTNMKSIIGQQGDKSNMNKLASWLKNWYQNHTGKNRPKLTKPSPWAKNDDGAFFKCALLSGPPGVGKTTTATLVAKELGFDVVEFNASDKRSKKLLHVEVSQLLSTTSLATYFNDGCAPTTKHVLLMDEVDGMAGNEDRGGMQELIALIKNTQIPIVCMCNDRQHPKIRSLVNYCLDLRFTKPRIEQIKGAMMSICFKEGLRISSDVLTEVINGAGMDIRQTLNNLSMWTSADKNLSLEAAMKESALAKKDTVIGPWEIIRKVFSESEHKNMTVADRSRLFFYDYSIGPLFVQENYLQVVPHCPKSEFLERLAAAADSISMGDVIDKKIRSTNNWALLESQAMYSSVLPGHYMEGHMGGQINFPSWLGKNSKRGKFQRLLSELQAHMRTSISGSKLSVNTDYIYHLRNKIVRPLVKKGAAGVRDSLDVMKAYNLLREDLDSILELAQWPKQKDPMAMVDSKVKAAFTRAYNKEGPVLPYAVQSAAIKKRATGQLQDDNPYDEEEQVSSDGEGDDITNDAMIKEKKKTTTKVSKKESVTKKPSTSRARNKKPK